MPVSSVLHYEGKNYIFVRNDEHTFEMLEVQTGTEENNQVEVVLLAELNGREVVYNGAYALLMTWVNQVE